MSEARFQANDLVRCIDPSGEPTLVRGILYCVTKCEGDWVRISPNC